MSPSSAQISGCKPAQRYEGSAFTRPEAGNDPKKGNPFASPVRQISDELPSFMRRILYMYYVSCA